MLLLSSTLAGFWFFACWFFLIFFYDYRRLLLLFFLLFELLIPPVSLQLLKDFPFTLLSKLLGVCIIAAGNEKDCKSRDNQVREDRMQVPPE